MAPHTGPTTQVSNATPTAAAACLCLPTRSRCGSSLVHDDRPHTTPHQGPLEVRSTQREAPRSIPTSRAPSQRSEHVQGRQQRRAGGGRSRRPPLPPADRRVPPRQELTRNLPGTALGRHHSAARHACRHRPRDSRLGWRHAARAATHAPPSRRSAASGSRPIVAPREHLGRRGRAVPHPPAAPPPPLGSLTLQQTSLLLLLGSLQPRRITRAPAQSSGSGGRWRSCPD